MTKLVLILIAIVAIGTSTSAPSQQPASDGQSIAAVGGGVQNPWRSPYKIV